MRIQLLHSDILLKMLSAINLHGQKMKPSIISDDIGGGIEV